jgi:hypothetical protein
MDDFASIWKGGYYEGDPMGPKSPSSYGDLSNMSILHATYLRCIKPYVSAEKVALEIGPGRGAWSRCMLGFKELHVMDPVLPAVSGFWDYVGDQANVFYHIISDYSCNQLEDNSIDYMFSFGTFCHIPQEGIIAYAENLSNKLRYGADCFWMIADRYKYFESTGRSIEELEQGPGRWYGSSIELICHILRTAGYKIIDPDVGTCLRDPIIYFRKE